MAHVISCHFYHKGLGLVHVGSCGGQKEKMAVGLGFLQGLQFSFVAIIPSGIYTCICSIYHWHCIVLWL